MFRPVGWRESNDSELTIARIVAENGWEVVLRIKEEGQQAKTSDAFVFSMTQWEAWEFKAVQDAKNLEGTVQLAIRRGRKQAPKVLLYLKQQIASLGEMEAVNEGIQTASRQDEDKRLLQCVILMAREGAMRRLSREELDNGENFTEF